VKFSEHPKVIAAKKLLKEAELEFIAEAKERESNHLCQCGHARKDHGPAHSINYTGGSCNKCECLNFLFDKRP